MRDVTMVKVFMREIKWKMVNMGAKLRLNVMCLFVDDTVLRTK